MIKIFLSKPPIFTKCYSESQLISMFAMSLKNFLAIGFKLAICWRGNHTIQSYYIAVFEKMQRLEVKPVPKQ